MSSVNNNVVFYLTLLMLIGLANCVPSYYPTSLGPLLYPSYSKSLNLDAKFYQMLSNGHSSNAGYYPSSGYGTRHGQGFVGNPGIGITQSSATLANVYGQPSMPGSALYPSYGTGELLMYPPVSHPSSYSPANPLAHYEMVKSYPMANGPYALHYPSSSPYLK